MAKTNKILQLKITLKGLRPPIWRRILVPDSFTFWDLHMAIQDSMGWENAHLHDFTVFDPNWGEETHIGIPDDSGFDEFDTKAGWKVKIKTYLSDEGDRILYNYDFGDNWEHNVDLEKILPISVYPKYPVCIGGKRACPPEDCGGIWGYADLLEIRKDPNNEAYESMMEWLGDDFNPEEFNADSVFFTDPKLSLEFMLR